MTYDKDLNGQRMAFIVLAVISAPVAVLNLLARNWLVGAAEVTWVFCCIAALWSIHSLQKTRDQARTLQAMVNLWVEKEERL